MKFLCLVWFNVGMSIFIFEYVLFKVFGGIRFGI